LPWRDALPRGMLGSDVVGFHTHAYKNHFASALQRILGVTTENDVARVDGRDVRLGVFPMGVDVARFHALSHDESVEADLAHILASAAGEKILLGVDRLDYTKGMI